MSGDSVERIARDLAVYLRQQQEAGVESFLDEGPVEVPELTATEPAPAPEPAPAKPEPAPAPPKPATSEPARPAVTADKDEEFQMACDAFVSNTLEQIRRYRQRPAVPDQADIFAEPEEPVAALSADEKTAALAELTATVSACEACKLHETRTRTVFGVGNPDAEVVFVGEAPGRHEDEQGEPFVGRAGKLLNDILKAIGFAREDIYICNILKCRPPQNRDPERDEVDACEPYLKKQLEILEPKVICCLGRHAAMTLLDTRASLRSLREAVHFYEGVPVMATYHPAALLRNPHWKRDTWDDVRKLRALHDALVAEDA